MGEHLPCKQDAAGSIPATSTICPDQVGPALEVRYLKGHTKKLQLVTVTRWWVTATAVERFKSALPW